jgi:hypothetical protein
MSEEKEGGIYWETQPTPRNIGESATSYAAKQEQEREARQRAEAERRQASSERQMRMMSSEVAASTADQIMSPGDYIKKSRQVLTLPSGFKILVRRPGPEIVLKAFRLPSNMSQQLKTAIEGMSVEQAGKEVLKALSDEDAERYMDYARRVIEAVSVKPRIRVGATDEDELDPSDLDGGDFWYLFGWAQRGGDVVPVGETEVTVTDVENFREDGGLPGTSDDGGQVQGENAESISANP